MDKLNTLNKEGISEFEYMIDNKATIFPTYNCPFITEDCEDKYLSVSERYDNREKCLKCKEDFLKEILEDSIIIQR